MMAAKWKKPSAPATKGQALRSAESKIKGKLHDWDFLPIGKKIENLETLLSAVKNPVARTREFGFLSLVEQKKLGKFEGVLSKRLRDERKSLEDMKAVFSHWGIDLGKAGLGPEDISYPHRTKWWRGKQELLLFSSPAMAKWYDENLGKHYQPSRAAPDEWVQSAIRKGKAFGLGRIYVEGKGIAPKAMQGQPLAAVNKLVARFHPPTAEITLIQPLVFYKKAIKGADEAILAGLPFRTRELLERGGVKGTARTVPLANPDLLLLYAQLKEAKNLGAKTATVYRHPSADKAHPFKVMAHPFRVIYDRIAKLSHPHDASDLRYAMHAVFHRKQ